MFFRKKRGPSIEVTTLSPTAQIRKVIYDTGCKNPEQVAILMGLTNLSSDVAEMETYASELRINRLLPIFPVVESHAMVSAQVSAMSYFQSALEDGEEMPEEELVIALTQMFKFVSFSAAVSCLAALFDLGLIQEGYDNV
ncbi:hypothetical protein UFOVP621_2 [uncultured Caudovirales phage]|uniref:Uncharacterized protein n=1 Tax=uncultured Caudovirales phage TaxID=2100421 RepID=A0A6J5N4W3_9CAUD|nr:hypothetical protein UFOVP621_2 [uncultured Caudovirales phage]